MVSISSSTNNSQSSQQGPRGLSVVTTTPFSTASSSSTAAKSQPQQPPPPPAPCPWLWRCHSCYTIYRLAVTRRCLDCDHTFCLGDAAASGPARGGKKRRRGGPCKAEFDYTGWKTQGAWRRTVLLNGQGRDQYQITSSSSSSARNVKRADRDWGDEHKATTEKSGSETTKIFDDKREHLFLRKQHNCFLHCDFPSECHHSLFRAQQEGRPILREALALDAAREAVAEARQLVLELGSGSDAGYNRKKKFSRRLTLQEYKAQRQAQVAALSTRFPYSENNLPLLPAVDEEADEEDNNTVSPCSPTSPDPPGDLMREVQQVSPIEQDNNHGSDGLLPPVSPGGTTRRRSLLVATDTPADFATTAAPLCFDDDTYSDDDGDDDQELEGIDEGGGDDGDDESDERKKRRAKRSRRKIAQLTGEEQFGPFVFDTLTSSPTSPPPPSRSGQGITVTHEANTQSVQEEAAALDLQAAYSESAWFGNSPTVTTTITADPSSSLSPRSPERVGKRDRMLALLGRRAIGGGGGGPSCSRPTRSSSSRDVDADVHIDSIPAPRENHQHQQQHHSNVESEEWDDWSSDDSSSSSSASSISGPDDTDADGDVAMRDAEDVDDNGDDTEDESPAAPPRHRQRSGGDGTDEDLRVLLRMRNAFMRGDMI